MYFSPYRPSTSHLSSSFPSHVSVPTSRITWTTKLGCETKTFGNFESNTFSGINWTTKLGFETKTFSNLRQIHFPGSPELQNWLQFLPPRCVPFFYIAISYLCQKIQLYFHQKKIDKCWRFASLISVIVWERKLGNSLVQQQRGRYAGQLSQNLLCDLKTEFWAGKFKSGWNSNCTREASK